MSASPRVQVDQVRRLVNDGNHNAFTDLCRFQGNLYLTYRRCPEGHMVFASSAIVVLTSPDGVECRQVNAFSVPTRDCRDPHFLVFNDTLFVYTGTWLCKDDPATLDMNEHLGYGAWSRDGHAWHGPEVLEGTYGHYVWRAAAYGGKAYLCGRRKRGFVVTPGRAEGADCTESALLESADGLVWRFKGLFQDTYGDETAFLFEPDGRIVAVARSLANRPAQLCQSSPPYATWSRTDLERYIGGPLLAKWGDRYLVGGRKVATPKQPRTALYWLENGHLDELVELPSGGDNSYPGFVQLSADRALVSYYSSHEGSGSGSPPAAVYLAELSLVAP